MSKTRVGAYASIALGSVAIVCAAVGIVGGSAEYEVRVEGPAVAGTVPAPAADDTVAGRAPIESSEVAAGFTAYQDEDGNFVAPPPGTPLPAAATQQAAGPAAQWQNSVPGGGVGADASGFRMSQRAVVTTDGELGVACEPEQHHAASHNHDGEEHE